MCSVPFVRELLRASFSRRATQLATDRDYLAKLRALDRSALSASIALDATLLENTLRDDLLLNGTLEQWRHNPDGTKPIRGISPTLPSIAVWI